MWTTIKAGEEGKKDRKIKRHVVVEDILFMHMIIILKITKEILLLIMVTR